MRASPRRLPSLGGSVHTTGHGIYDIEEREPALGIINRSPHEPVMSRILQPHRCSVELQPPCTPSCDHPCPTCPPGIPAGSLPVAENHRYKCRRLRTASLLERAGVFMKIGVRNSLSLSTFLVFELFMSCPFGSADHR